MSDYYDKLSVGELLALDYYVKRDLIKVGRFLDVFAYDEDELIRGFVALSDYAGEILKLDDSPHVRQQYYDNPTAREWIKDSLM